MSKYQILADIWENTDNDDTIVSRKKYKQKPAVQNQQIASDIAETEQKVNTVYNI